MNDLPQYIAFRNNGEKNFSIYVRTVKADGVWYLRNENSGFSESEVRQYFHAFLKGNTFAEIDREIALAMHKEKHGQGTSGDAACPRCGFWYSFQYYDHNDGYYTPGILEDFSETVKCICGCKFTARIKVEISFSTKIIE